MDALGDCDAALSEKLYAGGSTNEELDADVADCHDMRAVDGPEGDCGDVGIDVVALSRSARRHACEQYAPLDSLSQARQKSWKQSMVMLLKVCRGGMTVVGIKLSL